MRRLQNSPFKRYHKFHFVVVPVLTYLLTTQNLSLEEINGLAIDVIGGGVDTVSSKQIV